MATIRVFKQLQCVLISLGTVTILSGVATAGVVPGTSCPTFPDDSWWHADVNNLPVHRRSRQWMDRMQSWRNLHPDFGKSFGAQRAPYGIPITVVDSTYPKIRVRFDYASESDRVRYPLGVDILVEGGQWKHGDRHTIVIDADTCRLYETWATRPPNLPGQRWRAGSGATWRLTSNKLRPDGWTSADAAGLPILPGLLTYEEVVARSIDHAIRFTTDVTHRSYLWPARHEAGSVDDPRFPPLGARFRLKKSYVIDPALHGQTKAILRSMKRYGLVLADNGSPWYLQGTADKRWSNTVVDELKQVPALAFEAVDTRSLMISPDSMKVRQQP